MSEVPEWLTCTAYAVSNPDLHDLQLLLSYAGRIQTYLTYIIQTNMTYNFLNPDLHDLQLLRMRSQEVLLGAFDTVRRRWGSPRNRRRALLPPDPRVRPWCLFRV